MRLVQVARRFTRARWGGTETAVLETSRRLRGRGHDVEILASQALDASSHEVIEGVPVRRHPYAYPYFGLDQGDRRRMDEVGGNLISFPLLGELRKDRRLDLIHLHTGKRLGGMARHAARRLGVPYVVTSHGGVLDVPASTKERWEHNDRGLQEWGKVIGWWYGSRRVLSDAAAVLCVGKPEVQRLERDLPGTRIVHLPNGVDTARFAKGDREGFRRRHGIPADRHLVLCSGRVDPQKNTRLAIGALARLVAEDPSWHLLLLGPVTDAAYAAELCRTIDALGLGTHVTWRNDLVAMDPELVDAYHAADVLILASEHEPFGIVVLEAWAAGLPVVAARVGGPAWLVHEGETGLLFEPGESEAAAEAIRRMRGNADLERRIVARARSDVRRSYDWSSVTGTLIALYEEVLDAHPVRA